MKTNHLGAFTEAAKPRTLAEKTEWIENYLAWLGDAHPAVSEQISYVDILDDGTINFVTIYADE